MKPIDHAQAKRWIQASLDGALSQVNADRLDAHLQVCDGCRQYNAQIRRIDTALRRQLNVPRVQLPKASHFGPSPSAVHSIDSRLRAKMKTQRISHFANAISFTGLLVILVAGLAAALSILLAPRSAKPVTGLGTKPIAALETPVLEPSPTSTPEWTITNPVTSTERILTYLDGLAEKTARLSQSAAWFHARSVDLGAPGMMQTSFIESWAALSPGLDRCRERVTLVKDSPDGNKVYQILVMLGDGTWGDLVQLWGGAGEVIRPTPDDAECTLESEAIFASSLVQRLSGKVQSKGTQTLQTARAWFDELDGRPVFVVEATFLQDPYAPYTRSVETFSFDLDSGLALRQQVRMQQEDGTQVGETLTGFQAEFLESLPADAARQFDQRIAQLMAFASPSQTPEPPTPAPTVPPAAFFDDLSYTQDNPLQDGQTILQLWAGLRQRYMTWLAKPGWYLFFPGPIGGDPLRGPYSLTHVLDASGRCETMTYYVQDGKILPQEIHLADGTWGLVSGVVQGEFSEGAAGVQTEGSSAGIPDQACQLESLLSVTLLDNAITPYRDLIDGKTSGVYNAWVQEEDGRRVLRLYADIQYSQPKPTVMHPVTRKFELIDHSERWTDFDIETGAWLAEWERFYLASGEVLDGEKLLTAESTAFEQPPADLKQAFDETLSKLNAYFESLGK